MILTLLPVALAGEPHVHADLSTLSARQRADVLYTSFEQHFESDGGDHWSCGTGLVAQLREHAQDFTPEQRARINQKLAPWGGDLLRPLPTRSAAEVEEAAAPPSGAAPPAATDTCFGQKAPNRLLTEHFSVEYEDGVSEAIAEQFADYLETARGVLVDEEGWTPIISDTRYLMLAYISADSGDGAYTTVDYCEKGGWMPYMVAYQNVFSDKAWAKEMAAHEFNHAQQYSYSFAHEFWFWEATATWIEDLVYPTSDGWAEYVNGGYSMYPHISLRASSQRDQDEFYHMYGMAIFVNFLEEHVGGKELVRQLWEDASTDYSNGNRTIEESLTEAELDFYTIYPEFIVTSTAMDYEDQDELNPPRRQLNPSELPVDETFDSSRLPEGLGQNYIYFKPELLTDELPDLWVRFDGDIEADSWIVRLVGVRDDAVAEVVEFEVVEGVGEGTLEDAGSFDGVWLAVSPLGNINKEYAWGLEADAVKVADPEPIDNEDDGNKGDRPLDTGAGVCAVGAGSGSAGPGSAGLVLLGLALAARRRR